MEIATKLRFLRKLEAALAEAQPWCDPDDPIEPAEGQVPPRWRAELEGWIRAYDDRSAVHFRCLCDGVSTSEVDFGDLHDFLNLLIGTVTSDIELAEGRSIGETLLLFDAAPFGIGLLEKGRSTLLPFGKEPSGGLPGSIHPQIASAAETLFRSGHHSEAVSAAAKMLVKLVRDRSGRSDLDGTALMDVVFSPKNPKLSFSDRVTQSEKDEHEGMYFLYKGAVLGVRNPRAHDFLVDSPARALEYIGLISLLANRLDEVKTKQLAGQPTCQH